jgi:hypothetical protein
MQYAGNVLVFGSMTPCDGDWFGGITPENAADFFTAFVDIKVGFVAPLRYVHACLSAAALDTTCSQKEATFLATEMFSGGSLCFKGAPSADIGKGILFRISAKSVWRGRVRKWI